MKKTLAFAGMLFLALGTVACSGAPTGPTEAATVDASAPAFEEAESKSGSMVVSGG